MPPHRDYGGDLDLSSPKMSIYSHFPSKEAMESYLGNRGVKLVQSS